MHRARGRRASSRLRCWRNGIPCGGTLNDGPWPARTSLFARDPSHYRRASMVVENRASHSAYSSGYVIAQLMLEGSRMVFEWHREHAALHITLRATRRFDALSSTVPNLHYCRSLSIVIMCGCCDRTRAHGHTGEGFHRCGMLLASLASLGSSSFVAARCVHTLRNRMAFCGRSCGVAHSSRGGTCARRTCGVCDPRSRVSGCG